MKSFSKKITLLIVLLVLAFSAALVGACTGATYTLTLDPDGGTLSTTTLTLKEGTNISDAVKDLKPVKEGLTFGAWFEGDEELSENRKMPAEDLKLTAKYKVGYTVEVYLYNGSAYALSAASTFTGSDYVDKEVTVQAPAIGGYVYSPAYSLGVSKRVLSARAAENVFKLYYNPVDADKITYLPNAPQGSSVQGAVADTLAGADGKAVVAENCFRITGYRFAGWSTTASGSVNYAPGDTVSLDGTLVLYAVWDQGYSDRFGGNDYIYLPHTESGVAVLGRGSTEFKGSVTGNYFIFELPSGNTLAGRIFPDSRTFAYEKENLKGTYIYRSAYSNDDYAVDTTDTIEIDEYGTATHYYETDGVRHSDSGVVTYYGEEYLFEITAGTNEGSFFSFITDRSGSEFYFSSTYGEAGIYYEFLTGDGVSGYFGEGGNILLDGYGHIYFYDSIFTGLYWVEDIYSNGTELMIYKIGATLKDNEFNQARDLLGFETVDGYFDLTFYTMPMDKETYAYITPKAEAGEYTSETDGTLILDGYRLFGNSAQYTDLSGDTVVGTYSVFATPQNKLLINLTVNTSAGVPTGETLTFELSASETGDIVFTLYEAQETSVEYILLEDSAFSYTLVLVLYDEPYGETANTRRASLLLELTQGKSDYIEVAAGYAEYRQLNSERAMLYEFHRTEVKPGVLATDIPSGFTFMLASTYDNSYFNRYVYYVYEYSYVNADGETAKEVNYTVVEDANDTGAMIWYMDIGVNTIGSLYFDADGNIYAGGFIVDTTSYYFGYVGTFVYYDSFAGGYEYLYFELELDGNGRPATFSGIEELEYPVYEMGAGGVVDGTVRLILRGNEALWSANGFSSEDDDQIRGTLRNAGSTAFGESIVEIVNEDEIVILTLVIEFISYFDVYSYVDIWVYYPYQAGTQGEFTAAAGTLVTDGYHRARYLTDRGVLVGTYSMTADGKVLLFNADGKTVYFALDGDTFRVLDGVYGSYDFYYLGDWFTLSFDGQGNLSALIGNIPVGNGIYNVIDSDVPIVTVFLELDEVVTLTLALGVDGFVLLDEELKGVFVGEDWSVLEINGYGSGSYYAANGSRGVSVYYDVISAADGYLAVRDENFNYYNFVLDSVAHTFRRPKTMSDVTYYAADFIALSFSADGEVYCQNHPGYYDILGDTIRLYLQEGAFSHRAVDIAAPSANGNCTVDEKTYYYWEKGTSVTLTGTVELAGGGTSFREDATLTFAPNGDVQFYVAGTFKVGSKEYNVTVVNQYWDYVVKEYRGLALYDDSIYEYSPFTEYSFNPNGVGTLAVRGGEVETTMHDGFEENDEGSYLTEHYIGFGPVRLTDTTVSGSLYVDGRMLTFKNAPVEATYYDNADLGYRYMAVFEADESRYAVHYHKYDGDYWLYMIATYDLVETNDYAVGVSRYFYSNGGFTFPSSVKAGTPFGLTLYKGVGEDRKIVVAYNSMFNYGGTSGWLLALGDFDVSAGAGELGSIYEIVFADDTLKAVTVTQYSVMQATGNTSGVYYFANFFVDDDGEIAGVACLATNVGGGYEFVGYTSVEHVGENLWVFHASDGYDYTMTLLTDEDGEYLRDETGEYWQISLTAEKQAAEA